MSKLVEGIKDRMVAAAREAAPAVVDAAQKAATAAAEKVAEAVADAKNAAGETSVASELATAAEPVAAVHAPEGAIFNPEAARGNLHLGIDVGSTTVKLAVLNDDNQIVYAKYQRHHTDVRACARDLFEGAATVLPTAQMTCAITGSGGLLLSQWLDLEFVQEVIASKRAVETLIPATDVAIELGGEDAKIIYFDNGIEQRMNGTCAGGTGAFIDQMATLLKMSADEMNKAAEQAQRTYTIASRCGVFAKSDIQPILNQGARKEDVAASIFQAVVDQTVAGLAQGRDITGKVVFLGGPLHFLKGLRLRFQETLKLDDAHAHFPALAPYAIAAGAAEYAGGTQKTYTVDSLLAALEKAADAPVVANYLPPLFEDEQQYEEFKNRHAMHDVMTQNVTMYEGDAYLGIDCGSTTTKLVLIGEDDQILFHHYQSNKGNPADVIREQLTKLYELCGDRVHIVSSAVTGYGEALIQNAFGVDFGLVETVAHFRAARHFCPDVDFIIDIGGQDIKCFKIRNKCIDNISLNEACSSGCGSFIETFARSMGYSIEEFCKLGLFAKHPIDLGSRCTVFMNSSVKQAQKDGAGIDAISAGLSVSVVKNALYKVIRAHSPDDLGQHIVVQGGTFLNDAILRSFEQEIGRDVTRPAISGLMGAYGAALHAKDNRRDTTTLIGTDILAGFEHNVRSTRCGLCENHCNLTINDFGGGRRFISGNRIYQRDHISVAFVVKKRFEDSSSEGLAYKRYTGDDTIDTLHASILEEIYQCRRTDVEDNSNAFMQKLMRLPSWLLRLVVKILFKLDRNGKVPYDIIRTDPNYASIFLTNLGSIGLDAGYHHLNNWGTNSFFGVIGKRHLAPEWHEDGSCTVRPVLDLGLTLDERIGDGFYYSGTVRLLRKLLENPELLEQPFSTEVEY